MTTDAFLLLLYLVAALLVLPVAAVMVVALEYMIRRGE